MQKGNLYIKVFNTLSAVKLMPCILSQLNILCSSMVKRYYAKRTLHPLFTVHSVRPFHAFLNVKVFIEAETSIYENVQYFIWSKKSVFNFTTVRYSLHKCSERIL